MLNKSVRSRKTLTEVVFFFYRGNYQTLVQRYDLVNELEGSNFEYRSQLAQSVEHQTFNLRVLGSSPISGE